MLLSRLIILTSKKNHLSDATDIHWDSNKQLEGHKSAAEICYNYHPIEELRRYESICPLERKAIKMEVLSLNTGHFPKSFIAQSEIVCLLGSENSSQFSQGRVSIARDCVI